jgi:hypothetical protein
VLRLECESVRVYMLMILSNRTIQLLSLQIVSQSQTKRVKLICTNFSRLLLVHDMERVSNVVFILWTHRKMYVNGDGQDEELCVGTLARHAVVMVSGRCRIRSDCDSGFLL